MAQSAIDKIPPGPKLDALTAEKVFGWKSIHAHKDRPGLYGKRQGKLGHWRRANVPNFSTNPINAYAIEGRMKELGRLDHYTKELAKITKAKTFPLNGLRRINVVGQRSKLWVSTVESSL
jgi:hypothetical protein